MKGFGHTNVTRIICVTLMMFAIFGHVAESVPMWKAGMDKNDVPVQPIRMNSSLIYRWLIRLMSRKDLYSWINFHVHPHSTPTTSPITDPTTTVAALESDELQIQRDTDDLGTVPIVGPGAASPSGAGNDGQDTSTGPALIVVRDVEETTSSLPVTRLSTASLMGNGIPMIILSGNKDVDRIGDDSQSTNADDSSTPQMIRDTFDDMPVAGDTMSPSGDNTKSVPIIVNPTGSAGDDSNSNDESTSNPDSSLTIVRDRDGEPDTMNDNDTPASSSSSSTSQSSSSTSGSTSSGLLILDPAALLNQGFMGK
ncbi:serine-rich adhesin for platelets-like [Ylistrum balloti]|uniref:serine-rich adhesin for platelets-like n=1 Tax=Ylistrum balloti TaxID=509963 RepID=UPI0029058967|nr:serine-rich adhesin for platelets-like [Ylistrum balloti]